MNQFGIFLTICTVACLLQNVHITIAETKESTAATESTSSAPEPLSTTIHSTTSAPITSTSITQPSTIPAMTARALEPEALTHFTGSAISSSEIDLSWVPPSINPGPLNYTINVFTVKENSEKDSFIKSVVVTGYSNTSTTIDGLYPYTQYIFEVYAETSAGNSTTEPCGPVRTHVAEPEAPDNFTGYAISSSEIKLSWVQPLINPGPLNYTIRVFTVKENSEKDSFIKSVVVTGYSNTSTTIDGLYPYTQYIFEVYAETSAGNSTTEPCGPVRTHVAEPNPPYNFTSSAVSPYEIDLSWNQPLINPGPLNYIIRVFTVNENDGENLLKKSVNITGYLNTSTTIDDLAPYTNYTFEIYAETSAGKSTTKTFGPVRTHVAEPNPPYNFTSYAVSPYEIDLSWNQPLINPGPLNYIIRVFTVNENDGENLLNKSVNITGYLNTLTTIDDLAPYTNYTFEIYAETSAGKSTTKTLGPVRTDVAKPNPPYNFTSSAVSPYEIDLSWNQPLINPGPLNYIIRVFTVNENDGENLLNKSVNITGYLNTSTTIDDLAPYTNYTFEIYAETSAGKSTTKTLGPVRTDVAKPNPPYNFTSYAVSPYEIDLSWNQPLINPGPLNYIIRVFTVNENDGDNLLNKSVNITGYLNTSTTIDDLAPYTNYTFEIYAETSAGKSTTKTLGPVRTDVAKPNPPYNFTSSAVSPYEIDLSWNQPLINPGPLNYIIRVFTVNENDGDNLLNKSVNITGYLNTSTTIDDLAPYTNYTFEIYAETSAGKSTTKTLGPVRTDVAKPNPPYNFTSSAVSPYEIDLSWNQPLINPGPLNYIIRVFTVNENDGDNLLNKSVNITGYLNTSTTIDDLAPYTNYTFEIYAETSAGKSTTKTLGPVRTDVAKPNPPYNFTSSAVSPYEIDLSWNQPLINPGPLNYIIRVFTVNENDGDNLLNKSVNITGYFNTSTTIDDLAPYTNYTFKIYAETSAGNSTIETFKPVRTHIAVPNQPSGLYCEYPTSRTLKVLWEAPLPYPGPSWYSIEVQQSRLPFNSSEGFDTFKSYNVTGYDNSTLIVDDVKPYWDYSVMVTAFTEVGTSSTVTISEPCHTPSARPGPVDSLEVDVLPDNKVLLTWSCPNLENRNGIIEKFQVKQTPVNLSRGDIELSSIETINKPKEVLNKSVPCETQYSFSSNVVPQVTYRFEVWAKVEEVDELGNVTWEEKSIPGSAPVVFFPDSDIVRPTPSSNELTVSSFNITICMKCLVNNSNGQIIAVGILVCKEGFCDDGIPDSMDQVSAFLSGLATWSQSRQQQFKKAFRVTTNDWQDSLLSGYIGDKSTSVDDLVFQVGSNFTCSTKLSDEVCNGPLPSGEKFQVRFYACTEAGCSITGTSGPYITAASVSEAVDPGLVGGAVGGCIMALLVIVLVVVFRRRLIGKHKKSDAQTNRNNGVHQDIPLTGIDSKDGSEDEDRCRPIKIGVFKEQLDKLHDNNNKLFEQEYTDLSMQTREHSMEVGARSEYRLDNRYTNILPYDHSRVELSVVKDNEDCSKSYINANFIPGFSSAKEFIATQGPLERTVKDFWRMVWEQGSSVIVMLSNFKEEDKQSKILKDKVHPYFPEEEESNAYSYGQISVCKTGIVESKEWEIRTFKLTHMKEQKSRFVKHFFFKYWSDHEADVHPSDMADFVQVVCEESSSRNTGPVVVHCSAGVGRTGTFICVSYFYKMISDLSKNVDRNLNRAADQTVDIFNRVLHLRDRRRFMVQTRVQYLFIYDTVLELIGRFLTVPNDAADGSNEDEKNAEHVYANVSDYMNFNGVSSQKVNGAFSMADEAKSEEETVYISMSASTKPLLKSEEAEEEPTYVNLSSSIKPVSKFGKAEEGSTFANLGSSKRPLSKLGKVEENSTYANLGSSKRYVSQLGNGEENSTSANFGSSKRYGSTLGKAEENSTSANLGSSKRPLSKLGKAEENSTYANLGSSKRYGSTLGKAEENSTSANLARSSRTVRL